MFLLVWLACEDGKTNPMNDLEIAQYQSLEALSPPPPPPPPPNTKQVEIKKLEQSLNDTRKKIDCMTSILTNEPLSFECETYVQQCDY